MKEEIVEVPKWFLENVENTLRIQNNINLDKKTGETCQDRNVKESLNGLRKLLSGEELTGMERLEKLHLELPQEQPQGLDEPRTIGKGIHKQDWPSIEEQKKINKETLEMCGISQGLDEAPKRKLRKVSNLREDLKADKPIEERLEELRHIRAEKDRLDDAAHNHAANNGGRWLTDDVGIKCFAFNPQEVEDAFKAGAEWMAGQGVTMTCTAVPTMLSNQPGESVFTADGLSWKEDELNVFCGDKVIVQIRKKNELD